METDDLIQIPVRQSLIKPILISGAEPKLAYLIMVSTFGVAAMSLQIKTGSIKILTMIVICLFAYYILMIFAKKIAKHDPQMLAIYNRHQRYKKTYPRQKPGFTING